MSVPEPHDVAQRVAVAVGAGSSTAGGGVVDIRISAAHEFGGWTFLFGCEGEREGPSMGHLIIWCLGILVLVVFHYLENVS